MTHTKGPWKLDIRVGCVAVYPADEEHKCLSGIDQSFIHYKGGEKIVTDEDEHVSWEVNEQDISNARLIAAAPELLQACLNARGAYDALKTLGADKELPGYDECLWLLKEAIRKAISK